jgi:hypothetical protein
VTCEDDVVDGILALTCGPVVLFTVASVFRPWYVGVLGKSDISDAISNTYKVGGRGLRTRADERGRLTTWTGDPLAEPTDIAVTDTITAMSLATGSATLAQARSRGHLTFGKTSDDGRRWAAARAAAP